MLKTFVECEENYDAYLRPAIYDSIKAVLNFYGLDSATAIYYNGENEIAKTVGSNMSDGPHADRYTDGIFRNKIFIVPEVNRSEAWTNRRQMVERPVLYNKEPGILLCPTFENKRIDVKVVSMFNSENTARQMKDRMNRLKENQVVDFTFSPTTHMVINPPILEFLEVIYDLLKKNNPSVPDPSEWLGEMWQFPVRVISNVAGNHKRVVIPLKQNRVGIQFSEPFVAKTNKSATYGRWEVEFTYSFFFNDFIGWEFEYPLNIYQDEIPSQYIPRVQPQHELPEFIKAAPEVEAGREIMFPEGFRHTPFYLKLPKHDPWAWPNFDWMQPVIQARLKVEDEPTQVLCNLFDIPDFVWYDNAKAYLLRRHAVAFQHFETPFLIQVFENDQLIAPEHLTLDEKGSITLHSRPVLNKTYRVVVTLDYAIRDYSDAFWSDLIDHPEDWGILPQIFDWFDFSEVPEPWYLHINYLRKHIHKGWGRWTERFNRYEMGFGLWAYRND
ncbi:hypothetical protein [Pseudomonas phage IR-QUMS-PaBa1-GHS-2021]|nr:hypothetical protein [Pseudomonas phage IR-QUMS-PaBa1-GHS-2021]